MIHHFMQNMKFYFITSLLCLYSSFGYTQDQQGIADSNNLFTFTLLHELQGRETCKNLVFSPFSISTALAMTYAGARNETALQISKTMCFARTDSFHSDFSRILATLDDKDNGKARLDMANSLWAQNNYKFIDDYIGLVVSNYNSEVKNVDFKSDTGREKAREEINLWVESKTNNKIIELITKGSLPSTTRLVLVNAIYFNADWKIPFDKENTHTKDFTLIDGTKIPVQFMNRTGQFKYYEDSKIQAIEIPYSGNKTSMVIVLPHKGLSMDKFVNIIDYQFYNRIISSLKSEDVVLSIPKFKSDCKLSLSTPLSGMGMSSAFSPGQADFSGMTGNRELYISEVIHEAYIRVDEMGTEAAAATAVLMLTSIKAPPERNVFRADHPFIYFIRDDSTGTILFMGKVMAPGVIGD